MTPWTLEAYEKFFHVVRSYISWNISSQHIAVVKTPTSHVLVTSYTALSIYTLLNMTTIGFIAVHFKNIILGGRAHWVHT